MEYKRIPKDRFTDVILHLRETFFADEPLNMAAQLCQRGESNEELERHSLSTLEDDLSLMAVTENDEIAGVILNGILRPGDIENANQKLDLCADENFKKIFHLLYDENLRADLFTKFDTDKQFDVRILSVDSRFRGQGLAKELLLKSIELAKETGFKIMKADATGIYSQKILASMGFEILSETFYDQYTDDSGKIILQVEPPHKQLRLMYKILE